MDVLNGYVCLPNIQNSILPSDFPKLSREISGLRIPDADVALLPRMQPAVPERGAPGGRPRNGPGISHKSGKPQGKTIEKTIEMTDRKVAIHSHPTMFVFDCFSIFLNVAGRHTIPYYNV